MLKHINWESFLQLISRHGENLVLNRKPATATCQEDGTVKIEFKNPSPLNWTVWAPHGSNVFLRVLGNQVEVHTFNNKGVEATVALDFPIVVSRLIDDEGRLSRTGI